MVDQAVVHPPHDGQAAQFELQLLGRGHAGQSHFEKNKHCGTFKEDLNFWPVL